jgi:hypothetical protein
MLKCSKALVAFCLVAGGASAEDFDVGCSRAATEAWCEGHTDCKISAIMSESKKGNNSEKGGYEECKVLAAAVRAQGVSLDARKAIKRMQAKIDTLNKDIVKEFGIKVTADFKRLELEELYVLAAYQSHYETKDRDHSIIVALTFDGESKRFENTYLDSIKTALYSIGKDEDGKAILKEKIKEIRLSFCSHGRTAWKPEIKVVDKVLLVPGVYSLDQSSYAGAVQHFIEKEL